MSRPKTVLACLLEELPSEFHGRLLSAVQAARLVDENDLILQLFLIQAMVMAGLSKELQSVRHFVTQFQETADDRAVAKIIVESLERLEKLSPRQFGFELDQLQKAMRELGTVIEVRSWYLILAVTAFGTAICWLLVRWK